MLTGPGLGRGRNRFRAGRFSGGNGGVRASGAGDRAIGRSWRLGTAAGAAGAAGTAALGLMAGTAQVGAIPGRGPSWELFYVPQPRSTLNLVLNERR